MLISRKNNRKERVSSELAPGSLSLRSYREIIAFPTAGKSSVINVTPGTIDVDAVIEVLFAWHNLHEIEHNEELYQNITAAAISYALNIFPKNWVLFDFCIRKFPDDKVQRLIVVPTGGRFDQGWKKREDEYVERKLSEKILAREAKEWRDIAFSSPYDVVTLDCDEYLRDVFREIDPTINLDTSSGRGAQDVGWSRVAQYLAKQVFGSFDQQARAKRKKK
jgi:hypothetical protein